MKVDDPYERTLYCLIAIDWTRGRLDETGILTGEQQQAMNTILANYDRRLTSLAQRAGKDEAVMAADRTRVEEELDNPSQKGKVAVSCIRALQDDT